MGDDAYGDRLIALFNERGIDTRYIKVDRLEQTGLSVVMIERNGTNRIIHFGGANKKICDTDVESAFSCYPDAVLTQFELRSDAVIAAARCAAEEGLPLFVGFIPASSISFSVKPLLLRCFTRLSKSSGA